MASSPFSSFETAASIAAEEKSRTTVSFSDAMRRVLGAAAPRDQISMSFCRGGVAARGWATRMLRPSADKATFSAP
jgi:hypothetical protein